jgi:hypothetical protein
MELPISLQATGTQSVYRVAPAWLWAGLILVITAWWTAWYGPSLLREHSFFPLWLGYILVVDGITVWRHGSSLLKRDSRRFAVMFVLSIPLWWLFEIANSYLGNWHYVLPRPRGTLEYTLTASLAFSTVLPAIFVTAELLRCFSPLRPERRWVRLDLTPVILTAISLAGLTMFLLSLTFPRYAFALVWVGVFLVFDPVNTLLGNPSVGDQLRIGRWDTVLVICLAGITCGFFWELWNVNSMPKWVYTLPYFDRQKLFEMPILGYGGYFPFALEVFAFWSFCQRLLPGRSNRWLSFTEPCADAGSRQRTDRA